MPLILLRELPDARAELFGPSFNQITGVLPQDTLVFHFGMSFARASNASKTGSVCALPSWLEIIPHGTGFEHRVVDDEGDRLCLSFHKQTRFQPTNMSLEFGGVHSHVATRAAYEIRRLLGARSGDLEIISEKILALRDYAVQLLADPVTAVENKPHKELSLRLTNALRFIEDNLPAVLNVETISEQVGEQATFLQHSLQRVTGLTVPAYIQSRRANRAAVLLLAEELMQEEIAFLTGFDSVPKMRQALKDTYGDLIPPK